MWYLKLNTITLKLHPHLRSTLTYNRGIEDAKQAVYRYSKLEASISQPPKDLVPVRGTYSDFRIKINFLPTSGTQSLMKGICHCIKTQPGLINPGNFFLFSLIIKFNNFLRYILSFLVEPWEKKLARRLAIFNQFWTIRYYTQISQINHSASIV